ncbi:MAG: hypothetical protein H6631_07355 [Anaerolineaceae bacterium]|nr:hypothetical protein [Anaerolineaceae bacterium]MCB9097955.1 hypothetical protein [Anaerolineales bacterium]
MSNLEEHSMELERVHPSGAEEWVCHTCGRRFLLTWPPDYTKVIINAGDEQAVHNGSKGGVRLGRPQVERLAEPTLSEDVRRELEAWLEEIDIDGQLGLAGQ